jgi:hypothetical protein
MTIKLGDSHITPVPLREGYSSTINPSAFVNAWGGTIQAGQQLQNLGGQLAEYSIKQAIEVNAVQREQASTQYQNNLFEAQGLLMKQKKMGLPIADFAEQYSTLQKNTRKKILKSFPEGNRLRQMVELDLDSFDASQQKIVTAKDLELRHKHLLGVSELSVNGMVRRYGVSDNNVEKINLRKMLIPSVLRTMEEINALKADKLRTKINAKFDRGDIKEILNAMTPDNVEEKYKEVKRAIENSQYIDSKEKADLTANALSEVEMVETRAVRREDRSWKQKTRLQQERESEGFNKWFQLFTEDQLVDDDTILISEDLNNGKISDTAAKYFTKLIEQDGKLAQETDIDSYMIASKRLNEFESEHDILMTFGEVIKLEHIRSLQADWRGRQQLARTEDNSQFGILMKGIDRAYESADGEDVRAFYSQLKLELIENIAGGQDKNKAAYDANLRMIDYQDPKSPFVRQRVNRIAKKIPSSIRMIEVGVPDTEAMRTKLQNAGLNKSISDGQLDEVERQISLIENIYPVADQKKMIEAEKKADAPPPPKSPPKEDMSVDIFDQLKDFISNEIQKLNK